MIDDEIEEDVLLAKLTFRPQALEKLASPEQLDQLIRVAPLKSWLWLCGLACLLAPLVIWSVWGSLETRITASGLLLPAGGLCTVRASDDGQVTAVGPAVGDEVQAGQVIARLQSAGAPYQEVYSPCAGKTAYLAVRPGDQVEVNYGVLGRLALRFAD